MSTDTTLAMTAATAKPRGRPRKTLEEREDGNRKGMLILAAAKLFKQKGFDATSTRDIAAAVGMRSGSPFYHFKSKGDLLHAVMVQGFREALEKQRMTLLISEQKGLDSYALLRALIQQHFEVLLGENSDFIPVMQYEWRSLTATQQAFINKLQRDYETDWVPVLQALHDAKRLHCPVKLALLLIFGALNWSVQWFDADKPATLSDLTDAAMALFIRS